MAKLNRAIHKVFGNSANANNIGQFGSAVAGTKKITKNIAEIQELDAWEKGWEAGTVGGNRYPAIQERNGLDYEMSYQIGYMLQEGIAEWNANTTYYKGSIIKAFDGTTARLYASLIDDNVGNAPNETSGNWALINPDLDPLFKKTFVSVNMGIGNGQTNLNDILPKDGQIYYVFVSMYRSGGGTNMYVNSDICDHLNCGSTDGDSGRSSKASGNATIPVGTGRFINCSGTGSATLVGYMKA